MFLVHLCRRETAGNGYAPEKFRGGESNRLGRSGGGAPAWNRPSTASTERNKTEPSLLGAQVDQFTELGFAAEDVALVAMERALGLQRSLQLVPGTV